MARLVTAGIVSLDGYVADAEGAFDWAFPDDELHQYVNAMESGIGTYLYGRRMYEVMSYWASPPEGSEEVELEYAAIWQDTDKIVYSTTLDTVSTPRTELRRAFDADEVRALKATADRDLSVSGPGLAASAYRARLVDEVSLFVNPVVVGGGTPFLPTGLRLDLRLTAEHRFPSGVVHLRYAARH
jgi:dihydrofolate reductase